MVRSVPVILVAVPLLAVLAACGKNAEFRHGAHLTVTKGECAPCHGSDASAPRPAADADCAACHKQAQEPPPSGAGRYGVAMWRPESPRPGRYGGRTFSHAPHAAAGIGCAECHEASKWRGNRFVFPTAEDCAACHSGPPGKGSARAGGAA